MSESSRPVEHEDEPAADEGTELQFDEAEPTAPAPIGPSCAGCKRPIEDEYYEINGKVICSSCRQQIEASFRGGSGLARLIKASILGVAAAVVGAVVYYTVQRVTGWNIGYVAVFVGFLVGGAVRKGTGNRGGLPYQCLALLLSYIAIGLMGFAIFLEHGIKEAQKQQDQVNVNPVPAEQGRGPDAARPEPPAVAAPGPNAAKAPDRPGQAPTTDAAGA